MYNNIGYYPAHLKVLSHEVSFLKNIPHETQTYLLRNREKHRSSIPARLAAPNAAAQWITSGANIFNVNPGKRGHRHDDTRRQAGRERTGTVPVWFVHCRGHYVRRQPLLPISLLAIFFA